MLFACGLSCFFFFNRSATTQLYTLSLHDALPICQCLERRVDVRTEGARESADHRTFHLTGDGLDRLEVARQDRKSTRLNSSHQIISYAVFCLKKKKKRSSKIT